MIVPVSGTTAAAGTSTGPSSGVDIPSGVDASAVPVVPVFCTVLSLIWLDPLI